MFKISGRFGRSVTFATEHQRKLVREIVKQSRTAVKSRIVPSNVIDKYANKIAKIEPDVTRVVEEEKAEREIAMLENRANRMQKELTNGPNDRAWIDKSKKNKKQDGDKKEKGKKARRKRKMGEFNPEEREMNDEGSYIARDIKRKRKPQRIRSVVEDNHLKRARGSRGGVKNRERKNKFNKKK